MWYCKMYFPGMHEIIESDAYGVQGAPSQRKVLPFLESLLSFTELDVEKITPALRRVCEDLESQDRARVANALIELGVLANEHSFFLPVYTKWFYFQSAGFEKVGTQVERAQHELRKLPEALPLYQKQVQRFFDLILDVDKAGREPSQQIMRHYHFDQPDRPGDAALFPFRLLTTRFEPVGGDACAPVLYADTVADMISFSLQTCVERNITVRRCKNCGRYFAQTGRVSAEYCDRAPLDGQTSCRAIGAFQQWTLKQADDPVFKAYRREYKRRFAWIKAGRISDGDFYAWSEQARAQKKRCDKGGITLEEFQRWLKES